MSWNTLRGQITDLLDNNTNLVEVSGTPKLEFSGYPSAYVIPSDHESDYETTTENQRFYNFIIRVFYETAQTGLGEAINRLEGVVDEIIDAFDQEDKKKTGQTIGQNLPANYIYLSVEAIPSAWGELPAEKLITAEIRVRIRVSYDAS